MKGVYTLVIEAEAKVEFKTRSRSFKLGKGFYAYVGSAMNSLENRVARHLSPDKKRFWHIDYLLELTTIRAVVSAQTDVKAECQIVKHLTELTAVRWFGCSDCSCMSHLFWDPDLSLLTEKVVKAFEKSGLHPAILLI